MFRGINGRLKALEPHIETDSNGKMVEEWIEKFSLHHLNQSEKCIEVYTYGKGRFTIFKLYDSLLIVDKV